jgi:hypothetical protein
MKKKVVVVVAAVKKSPPANTKSVSRKTAASKAWDISLTQPESIRSDL